jgi:hypothetical protein
VSQLIQKLKIAARLEVTPLGFAGINKAKVKPSPVLVARITGDEKQIAKLVEGADAVFIDTHQEEAVDRVLKQFTKNVPEMIYGCWLGVITNSASDFYAVTLDTDMNKLKGTEAGKAIIVDPDLEDRYLRQLDSLPVDAIVMENKEGVTCRLTVKNYILCRRMALAASKPLVIHADLKITAQDVEEMWNSGIDGFVVDVDTAFPSAVKELRQAIDKLELNPRHNEKMSVTPLIPVIKMDTGGSNEPLPDEEDDDDDFDE